MDRKTFLKGLVVLGAGVPCGTMTALARDGKCEDTPCMSDAGAVRQFLSDFLRQEEQHLDRATLVKLMHERGRACCRNLKFRQELIDQSAGNVDKLIELMGKIVGPENCTRSDNRVTLVYPVTKCVCGWSPERTPSPDDPYCECSAENNRTLFETVARKPVSVKIITSPRRGGVHCTFQLKLAWSRPERSWWLERQHLEDPGKDAVNEPSAMPPSIVKLSGPFADVSPLIDSDSPARSKPSARRYALIAIPSTAAYASSIASDSVG